MGMGRARIQRRKYYHAGRESKVLFMAKDIPLESQQRRLVDEYSASPYS